MSLAAQPIAVSGASMARRMVPAPRGVGERSLTHLSRLPHGPGIRSCHPGRAGSQGGPMVRHRVSVMTAVAVLASAAVSASAAVASPPRIHGSTDAHEQMVRYVRTHGYIPIGGPA